MLFIKKKSNWFDSDQLKAGAQIAHQSHIWNQSKCALTNDCSRSKQQNKVLFWFGA